LWRNFGEFFDDFFGEVLAVFGDFLAVFGDYLAIFSQEHRVALGSML
jgi:hypothetical protein